MSNLSEVVHRKLQTGSGAHTVLQILQSLHGQAGLSEWSDAVKRARAVAPDQWDVTVQRLINTGMVFQRRQLYIVSDDGLAWLGGAVDLVPRAEPLQVPARYVPPMRPLSRRNMPRIDLAREGSLDYRDIPSRFGDTLVPHRKA